VFFFERSEKMNMLSSETAASAADLKDLQFQMYRMQENMKEISKKSTVLGIDQSKDDDWVIVHSIDDGQTLKIMLNDCKSAYRGVSHFSLIASIREESIHIGDIKGPHNEGYGSICMAFLKEKARDRNLAEITGDIAPRDWDHVDRLVHFYEKHHFEVEIDHSSKSGAINWMDS
jgi:GNAT superfamily N-acetyltransferase